MKSARNNRTWAGKTNACALTRPRKNGSVELFKDERDMYRLNRGDEHGFIGPLLMAIPYLLLLIGAAMITGGSIASGLIIAGLGVLTIGVPGTGSLGTSMLRVAGPAGLIMIVLGAVLVAGK